MMKRLLFGCAVVAALFTVVSAQVTVPNTLVDGATITAGPLNTNFSTIANHALDRLSGGNLSGNVTADPGITIDGIDVGATVCTTCAPTFKDLTLASPATGLTVATHIVVNSAGQLVAAQLTGTVPDASFPATLPAASAANLTGLNATQLTTGTVAPARLGSGSPTALNYLRGDGAFASPATTIAKVGNYTAVAGDMVLATGTFTVTLPAAASNTNGTIDVKNVSTGVVTIGRTGADTIDGATSQSLVTQYQSMTFISDGTNWWIK